MTRRFGEHREQQQLQVIGREFAAARHAVFAAESTHAAHSTQTAGAAAAEATAAAVPMAADHAPAFESKAFCPLGDFERKIRTECAETGFTRTLKATGFHVSTPDMS
ncbi:MAG TPA: hypothetical protein VF778_10775 [Xanthobacteraceae bacterium]